MLEIHSLSAGYNDNLVLKDVSLSVMPGEILAVIGPNGAGKSTLIRTTSGVLPMRSGSVIIAGKDIKGLSSTERARLLAVVPQSRQLPPTFTVYQTVLLGRTPYLGWLGQASSTDHAKTRLAIQRTRMSDLAERQIGNISGGESQRVLLARALAQETPVLLLDEPTTHLDLQYQFELLSLVKQLAAKDNLAVVMVLHDLNLAATYADRVALMVNGQIFNQGLPHQVLTEDTLSEIYSVRVHVITHPDYGTPLVLPDGEIYPSE